MFRDSPVIASLVIVMPTVLIIGMCVCLCTISDGEAVEDYRSTDDEDENEPPPYASDVERSIPDDEELTEDADVVDPIEGGEGIRRRIRDEGGSSTPE